MNIWGKFYHYSRHAGRELRFFYETRFSRKIRRRIFCVGQNKTGTTSLEIFLARAGFRVAPQYKGEFLLYDWADGNYRGLINFCERFEVFQDVPFSFPRTYRVLFEYFPDAKFILTTRDNAEQWYQSLIRFHTKIVGKGRVPTADDLKAFPYRRVGWLWDAQCLGYGIDEATLYDPDIYKAAYMSHNREVSEYFSDKPGNLLEVNLSDPEAAQKIKRFLDISHMELEMPHLNRST